jgi:long-chain acyl-CoA synthetase
MRVEEMLEQTARDHPHKVALVCGAETRTYKSLDSATSCLAFSFTAVGLHDGERVAIFMESSVESVLSVFAVLKSGGIFLILAPGTKMTRLISILNDSSSAAVVTDAAGAKTIHECRRSLSHLRVVYIKGSGPDIGSDPGSDNDSDRGYQLLSFEESIQRNCHEEIFEKTRGPDTDPAALIYTSGSTGESKGVVLSHLNISFSTDSIVTYLTNTDQDIILNVLPFSHSYGLTQLMTSIRAGATLILAHMLRNSGDIVELMATERVTGFAMTPTIAGAFAELDLSIPDLSALRYVTNASDALPLTVMRRLLHQLPHVQFFSMYGLTECIRVSFLPPDQVSGRPTSIGRGLPVQEMYLVDEQGSRLGPGTTGELVVQGPNVMLGYWGKPTESEKVMKVAAQNKRVFFTGDFFRMDEEGYFYFLSRKDDIIKTCDQKVAPMEVERVICSIPGVKEAVVLGVPDSILGHAVKAVVRVEDGVQLSRREIISQCKQHLESFKVPTFVEFCDHFPKTSTGKVERYKLAAGSFTNT